MNSYNQPSKPRTSRSKAPAPPLQAVRLLDQVRERIRYKHYSYRTEQQYVYWVRFLVRFHGLRHPRKMGAPEVERFLSWLAVERKIASEGRRPSTQDDRGTRKKRTNGA